MNTSRARGVRCRRGLPDSVTSAVAPFGLALALVLGPAALALPAGPSASATPSTSPSDDSSTTASPDADEPAVTLTLTDMTPAVAQLGDTMVLTGTITNTTDADFVDPTLQIRVQQAVPGTAVAMERWFDASTGPRGRTVPGLTGPYPVTVPAGGSAPFSFSIPVDGEIGFPIRYDNWGPRGLEVALSQGGTTVTARTMGVFHPGETGEGETGEAVPEVDLQVGVLLPLTPTAQEWTDALAQGRAVSDLAGERVRDLVEATGPAVSWALDPALLGAPLGLSGGATAGSDPTAAPTDPTTPPTDTPDPAPDTGEDPTDPADPDDPDAPADPADPTDPATLTGDLVAAAGDRDILALPFADADVPALAGTGETGRDLLTAARESANELFAAVGLQVSTTTAWPAAPGVSQDALRLATGAGYSAVVLDGVEDPDDAEGASTSTSASASPSARTDVTSGAASVPALVSDPRLSEAVSGEAPPGATTSSETLASRQYALALSAVLARDVTADRTVLVTADRTAVGAIGTPDGGKAAALGSRVTSLLEAPWVTPTGLDEAFASTPSAGQRTTLPVTGDVTSAAFARGADLVVDGLTETMEIGSALERPEVLDGVDDVLRTALSGAWRLDDSSPAAATDAAEAVLQPYRDAVTVSVPASLVDLFAEEGAVNLTLTNTLDQRVTVDVRITPDQPALRVDDVDPVTIDPGASTSVRVPMVAVANGLTRVDVDVLSPDGAALGPVKSFDLRVRAEWETVGTGIVAAGLGVLLVIGLIRTFRRGRRGSDGNVPAPTPTEETP
ncbi:hypothetical protein C8046_11135 [Serinibacter arcticus]|uniref:Uncharacterized protein n=1 Tax=Serinibacter arcticus TaxID=1655435 RepID=A0A2U1ZVU6_9MICO|nr:DUF6049 family protein [Serinibacter arcticus]PWD51117.1 hypothetical protein C8046_11135 [Serinibacter arcticus]